MKQLITLLPRTNDTLISHEDILDARDRILDGIIGAFKIKKECNTTKITILDVLLFPMTTNVDQVIAEIFVDVTNECPYDFLIDKMRSPSESRIEVYIRGAIHTFEIDLLVKMSGNHNNNLYDGYAGINVLSTLQRSIMNTFDSVSKKKEFLYFQTPVMECPFYILSKSELCALMLNNSQISSVSCENVDNPLFKTFTVVTTDSMLEKRYFICTEVYLQQFRNSSNSTKMLGMTRLILAFICTLLSGMYQ